MIARSPTSWPPSCSHSGTPISNNATATATSSRWSSQDIPMSSSSTRREFPVKKPLEPFLPRSSRSLSLDEPDSDPEAPVLPPPAAAAIATTYNRPKKTLRIDGGPGLRIYWARFRRRLGAGTAPSTSSLVDSSAQGSNDGFRSDIQGGCEDETEVNEVVVDRNWSDEIKSSVSLSEQDISLDRPGHHHVTGPNTDRDSVALHTGGFWGLSTPLIILRWRVFPAIVDFFSTKFPNKKSEQHYVKENWFMRKVRRPSWAIHTSSSHTLFLCMSSSQPLALWSSLFLVVNWAVNAATIPGPILLIDKIFVFGVRKYSHCPSPLYFFCSLCSRLHLPVHFLSLYSSSMTGHVTVQ